MQTAQYICILHQLQINPPARATIESIEFLYRVLVVWSEGVKEGGGGGGGEIDSPKFNSLMK